jgi:hypothetical protein
VWVSKDTACYGRLAVMSDMDDDGFALNVDGRKVQDLCYNTTRKDLDSAVMTTWAESILVMDYS